MRTYYVRFEQRGLGERRDTWVTHTHTTRARTAKQAEGMVRSAYPDIRNIRARVA